MYCAPYFVINQIKVGKANSGRRRKCTKDGGRITARHLRVCMYQPSDFGLEPISKYLGLLAVIRVE